MEILRNIFLIGTIISRALVVYYIDVSNKQSDPQEIKVGSIAVLGEDGSLVYAKASDVRDDYFEMYLVLEGDSILSMKTGIIKGINTKDINPEPPMHSIIIYPK